MNEVIKALESCRNTYIGDDSNPYMKGISGGEASPGYCFGDP